MYSDPAAIRLSLIGRGPLPFPDMKPGSDHSQTAQDTGELPPRAVLDRLPEGVEYTDVKMIVMAVPGPIDLELWTRELSDDRVLAAFRSKTYGAVDRALRHQERALGQLPETAREAERQKLEALRYWLFNELLGEMEGSAVKPGDRWLSFRLVDPDRLGKPSEPNPLGGAGVIVEVWEKGRKGKDRCLGAHGLAARSAPWGDSRIPWIDPTEFLALLFDLMRRHCRPLLRRRAGQRWRTRRSPEGWKILTQYAVPALYEYLRPFYRARRYTIARHRPSQGNYPKALLSDIRDILRFERPTSPTASRWPG